MKAVTLLSGGLDSVVSTLLAMDSYEIVLALTFDYGQRAVDNEKIAAASFCRQNGIEHQIIHLPFMANMKSGIIEDSGMPLDSPWVPNHNGLFINIAACYAENLDASLIVCGFNRDEGVDVPDNTREYVEAVNHSLFYSSLKHTQVISLVQDMDKVEIIKTAAARGVDFSQIWSCYLPGKNPCSTCPSCIRNQQAFEKAGIAL
jgi:7-cyano-7-deazaguanine synthase